MDKTYLLQPDKQVLKQGFFLTDEYENIIYEAKMLKRSVFGAMLFEFKNYITGHTEEHKVGQTLTSETQSGNYGSITDILSTNSRFKFDGKNIWDYLHEQGVRLETHMQSGKIGMAYDVSLKGEKIGHIASSSPKGKSVLTSRFYLDVTCSEENLDLVFLTAFAIARTEQTFYR